MVRTSGTRFLVVTHHPLTMARMDQLFGVTMQERGISRVLSVDLQRATQLTEQPKILSLRARGSPTRADDAPVGTSEDLLRKSVSRLAGAPKTEPGIA